MSRSEKRNLIRILTSAGGSHFSIADEVAGRIVGGKSDDRLSWLGDGRVRVEVGKIFPAQSGYKQTVQCRRMRLREALIERLSTKGWAHLGRNTFGLAGACSKESS